MGTGIGNCNLHNNSVTFPWTAPTMPRAAKIEDCRPITHEIVFTMLGYKLYSVTLSATETTDNFESYLEVIQGHQFCQLVYNFMLAVEVCTRTRFQCHPHPSPCSLNPSPSAPASTWIRPHPSPHRSVSVPTRPRINRMVKTDVFNNSNI